ncbi:MAG: alpha-glucosidase C-terminal domain-containing protein [Acidobacteriota bacterium]|nr:alpha-glucosidase C-terminal domain-containing protein [Acidobacteriota bacterium]
MALPGFLPRRCGSGLRAWARRLLAVATLTATCGGQTLARPGWAGSGMQPNTWWRHAVLYQVDPHQFQSNVPPVPSALANLTQRLDYLRSLGVDAVLLHNLQPEHPDPAHLVDPALGSLDDFDDLLLQASRREMRVLLDLDPASTPDLQPLARFWLSRGVAGFHLIGPQDHLHDLRVLLNSFVGERILIADQPAAGAALTPADSPNLLLVSTLANAPHLDAATLRTTLSQFDAPPAPRTPVPLLLTDAPGQPRSAVRWAAPPSPQAEKLAATILLTTRGSSMLLFGQEIGLTAPGTEFPWEPPPPPASAARLRNPPAPDPRYVSTQQADPDSVLSWYRQLNALRHTNLTLRTGTTTFLPHDNQQVLAFVRRPASITPASPALVVVCNLSSQPVEVALHADTQHLGLRGNFLRTLARSDGVMGPMDLDHVQLAPYMVYLGELRY